MEWGLALLALSTICFLLIFISLTNKRNPKLPPGPPGWPLFGNMFDLGLMPHQALAKLTEKYGPVMWLRLGLVNTMVLSSAESAMEMFKNHDATFANRNITEVMKVHSYNKGSMALGQYGPYWRMLRRLSTMELFTNNRINDTENLRRKCVDNMIKWVSNQSKKHGVVEVAHFVSLMSFNVIGNQMLSKDLVDPESVQAAEFFTSVSRFVEWGGKPNMADFFPFLKWLDPQGIKKKMARDLGQALEFASGFVKERVAGKTESEISEKQDFLDVLLQFRGNEKDNEPAKISENNINILILELFTASTDTTTSTIEWAMTELLRNPSVMKKVQAELDKVVGLNKVGLNKKVDECDIEHLHYLQAVLKETLRLHPAVPFLVPHRNVEDSKFMGYLIPKDTQVFVNVWAIGRDPTTWDDPLVFKPERFLGSNVDFKGHHFQLIPFGSGRRMCAGLPLAHRILHLALGSLIHSFEWDLEEGIRPEDMDMRERFGISLRKAHPLKALVKPRMKQVE